MAGSSPHLSVLGVPVTIVVEGDGGRAVVERVGPNGPEADVLFKAPYSQRFTVVKGLLGGSIGSGLSWSYLLPSSYPPSPNLKCTAIGDITGVKPFTDNFGWLNYEWSLIPAHFSVPTWDATVGLPGSDPSGLAFTTTRFRGSAEVFTPPTGAYYYAAGASNGKPVFESSVGVVRSRAEISMTRHMVPFIPVDTLLSYTGVVNDADVTIGDRTFPRGCLLFATFDTEPTSDPASGERRWDITYSFLGNYSIEWNEFMDPAGAWNLINSKADGTGDPPFEYVDFDVLFGDTF